jgi:hypothetical protein
MGKCSLAQEEENKKKKRQGRKNGKVLLKERNKCNQKTNADKFYIPSLGMILELLQNSQRPFHLSPSYLKLYSHTA